MIFYTRFVRRLRFHKHQSISILTFCDLTLFQTKGKFRSKQFNNSIWFLNVHTLWGGAFLCSFNIERSPSPNLPPPGGAEAVARKKMHEAMAMVKFFSLTFRVFLMTKTNESENIKTDASTLVWLLLAIPLSCPSLPGWLHKDYPKYYNEELQCLIKHQAFTDSFSELLRRFPTFKRTRTRILVAAELCQRYLFQTSSVRDYFVQ